MFKIPKTLLRIYSPIIGIIFLGWTSFYAGGRVAGPELDPGQKPIGSLTEVQAYDIHAQPLISITFDDASQTVYDTGFPILNSQGIPATFYFITGFLTDPWKTQLRSMEDSGWEIGSHTVTHPDLTKLSPSELLFELNQSKNDLEAAGLTITGFAYPYGSAHNNGAVLRQVKQTYSYARSVHLGYNSPIIDQYALTSQTPTISTSLETMKSWVDEAIENDQWLIISLHTVDNTGDTYSITPSTLSELADYIKSKANAGIIRAVTMRDGITCQNQTFWKPIHSTQESIEHNLAITNGRILWLFGAEIVDYLYDGYQWVENGRLYYRELNGSYHVAEIPTGISLQSISNDEASVQFTLTDSTNGDFNVISTFTLTPDYPFAKIVIMDIQGTATQLSAEKQITRRFSTNDGLQVTDGLIETGARTDESDSRNIFVFDTKTDLIRIITQQKPKDYSEYSSFTYGVFRSRPISKASELPYLWYIGGITFDTLHLLSEAEEGVLDSSGNFYTGEDASPKTGHTGIRLDDHGAAVTLGFTPPYQGNYILSIRQKGGTGEDRYTYQLDSREVVTRTVTGTNFGYANVPITDITAQSHSVRLGQASGTVSVDYILLIPTSRTINTPAGVEFPLDLARQIFKFTYLCIVVKDILP